MLAELRKGKKPEWLALLVFVAGYAVISYFHEPWFDEAQAWQIAKCASLKEILFKIPHYEGHPPLWHLILAIPAKLGVPYELGLKTVGFVFSLASVCLILFRSPYPRIVRLLLPFNYFIFYQFGVIVRPYGLMILLFLLMAIAFPSRNEHPWRFVGVLMLLCVTHSYGIMIAGGIAICLVWDLIQEKGFKVFFRELFRDRRTLSLGALLVLALLLVLELLPADDIYVASQNRTTPVWKTLLCMIFTSLPDCLLFHSEWFYQDTVLIQTNSFSDASLISGVVLGCLFWGGIVCLSSKKNLKYFVLPFLFFASFGGIVYMVAHHIGVGLGLLLFWVWVDILDDDRFHYWNVIQKLQPLTGFVRIGIRGLLLACLLIPIYWSVFSSVNDICGNYGYGRELAQYLKETGLENTTIYLGWTSASTIEDGAGVLVPTANSSLTAYFDYNIEANTNGGNPDMAYTDFRLITKEELEEIQAGWKEAGPPDVIIGDAHLEDIYDDVSLLKDYTIVRIVENNYFYKDSKYTVSILIYVRNDLLDVYNLEAADTSGILLTSVQIPDSLVEAYHAGEVTVEDIVDATIGDFGKTE